MLELTCAEEEKASENSFAKTAYWVKHKWTQMDLPMAIHGHHYQFCMKTVSCNNFDVQL